MAERPLLILPSPGDPSKRADRHGGPSRVQLPSRSRQRERIGPKLETLNRSFERRNVRLQSEATGIVPEEVIVLETVGPIDNFIKAVSKVEGLEWLGETEIELPSTDDFVPLDREGRPVDDKDLRGRLFLIFTNKQALSEILVLWRDWQAQRRLPRGFTKWRDAFERLHDIRPWGVQDRLIESGALDDWRFRIEHGAETIPFDIELWYRQDPAKRQEASRRVKALVETLGGSVPNEVVIQEIAYHSLSANIPKSAASGFLSRPNQDAELIRCEQIQFFRATGQMSVTIDDDQRVASSHQPRIPARLGEPVVGLFDGLPIQNHRLLASHLVIDDPDNFGSNYPAVNRKHGTAMSSLIVHGDLHSLESPLTRRIYVRPIMRPDPHDWGDNNDESIPESLNVVDLIHRAVRRMFEAIGGEPPAAPTVRVVNFSIGDRSRPFDFTISPLARLLDWLSWKYKLLFLVSAGNQLDDISLGISRAAARNLTAQQRQARILQAISNDTRRRRILSPAESINSLTVASINKDASNGSGVPNAIDPFIDTDLPSPINRVGMGHRRSIKPDILAPGGRLVLLENLANGRDASFRLYRQTREPGQLVASPGSTPMQVDRTWNTRGTSNATALTSRAASLLYDVLDDLAGQPNGDLIEEVPRAIWLKALLVHGARWGGTGELLAQTLRPNGDRRGFREFATRFLGFGLADFDRTKECAQDRAIALSGGHLRADQAHLHRFPLPPSLNGVGGLRRLVITLGWFTPINPAHQVFSRADLWFDPHNNPLKVDRTEADGKAVQRGTVQHEVLEGTSAAAYIDGDHLEVQVNCRAEAGTLDDAVPYALAITLEVDPALGIDIYQEIRTRVLAGRVRVGA